MITINNNYCFKNFELISLVFSGYTIIYKTSLLIYERVLTILYIDDLQYGFYRNQVSLILFQSQWLYFCKSYGANYFFYICYAYEYRVLLIKHRHQWNF